MIVEPSAGLAAWLLIAQSIVLFKAVAIAVPGCAVATMALRGFQQFTRFIHNYAAKLNCVLMLRMKAFVFFHNRTARRVIMSIVKSVFAMTHTPIGCASIAQAQTNNPSHSEGLDGTWLPPASEY